MIDFETYSEAGFVFRDDLGYFKSITRTRHGLPSVGAPAYAEHPSTEILSMAYDLDDGRDVQLWIPGQAAPVDLWDYVRSGRPVSAWNSAFEYYIWRHVAAARLGWLDLPWWQLRDPMARARAWSLPGKLAVCAEVLGEDVAQKDKDGKRLLDKFSKPRKPTKADPRLRLRPEDDPIDGHALYMYNRQDVVAETSVSARLPELSYHESTVWSLDQSINYRGVQIDRDALADCLAIVAQAENRYTDELISLTGGQVTTANQLQKMQAWLAGRGVSLGSLADESIGVALERTDLPGDARRLLEIRKTLSNSSVKKLHAISRRISGDGRLRDLFVYCGADRTGRWSGSGAQPQNLPAMSLPHGTVDDALWLISARSLDTVERVYGDPLDTVSACIRGLFIAAPGHELISSDYSAIEAVCLAALAGEQWRLDVFKGHGLIYETSAAMITGVSLAEQLEHRRTTGKHHPVRRIGKVSELSSGYGGSVGAWRKFGATGSDDEILAHVRTWRKTSPNIVKLWYAVERCVRAAIRRPGLQTEFRGLRCVVNAGCLVIRLPSGRCLHYHGVSLSIDDRIVYWGYSAIGGWQQYDTYGGKLVENITQAVARDVIAYAMPEITRSGYPIVLHVHDEIVSEVPIGFGSIEHYETIMSTLPDWCNDWPIKASGGWRGHRYRKS